LVVILLTLVGELRAADTQRASCADVIRELDRILGQPGPYRPEPLRIARRLGVEPGWVFHCADVYGRRLGKERPARSDEEIDAEEDRWESGERGEFGKDEAEAGDKEEPKTPAERTRVMPPTPTPKAWNR
jgi:hypothetical protein